MDDLLAQLDSRDKTVQGESAAVLKDADLNAVADSLDSASKKDGKNRFKARQASSIDTAHVWQNLILRRTGEKGRRASGAVRSRGRQRRCPVGERGP